MVFDFHHGGLLRGDRDASSRQLRRVLERSRWGSDEEVAEGVVDGVDT
jgi:hypothetical protein